MSDPDIRHAGWALGPGAPLHRRRSVLLGAIAAVLVVGGVIAAAWGVWLLAARAGVDEGEIVARGTVAALDGPAVGEVRFIATMPGPYTVWLRTGDMESNSRDMVVASVTCRVRRPGRADAVFQGNRQGASVVVGDHATVGVFTASAGENAVACRHEVFGRRGLRDRLRSERRFVVTPGSAAGHAAGFWYLFGGMGAAVAGLFVGVRWFAGSVRRRR